MTLNTLEEYGHSFQIKTLFILLTKKEFLNNVYEILNENDWPHQAHKWIVNHLLEYYNQFHSLPNLDYFKTEVKKIDTDLLKISLKEQLNEIYACNLADDLEYVEGEFHNFIRDQQLKKALLESVELLSSRNYDEIRGIIDNALKVGQDKNVGHEYTKDTADRYKEDDRTPIAFPWNEFNEITQGGYGKGDLVLIFGNPGGGKSWTAVSMAVHAAKLGKKVVFYSLELTENYVGKRFDAVLSGISIENLGTRVDKLQKIISDEIKGEIIIKGYEPRRASLTTIENHIKKLEYVHDFIPDVIFIDYLDLLKNKKGRKEKKDDIDDIFLEAKGLARHLNLPIVSPSQINRTGAKEDILEAHSIAGSYDKIMIGDISISLSRKRKDKLNGTGRFHIMKNRFGPDGMTYSAAIDTNIGTIEILEDITEQIEDAEDKKEKKQNYGSIDQDEKNQLKEFFKQKA